MKILHVINTLAAGGAEKLVSDIVPKIKAKGYEIDVLLLSDQDCFFGKQLKVKGINVFSLNENNLYSMRGIIKIRKFIKEYDIVHTHLFPIQYWVVFANMSIKGGPILLTTEHSTYNRRREKKIFKLIDKFVYSKYKNIISISQKTQDNLQSWIDSKDERFVVINNGIDISRFIEAMPYEKKNEIDISFNDDDIIIIQVARFNSEKDQKTTIEAIKLLDDKYKLVLVGDGNLRLEYEQLVDELNLSNRIKFLGKRKDVDRLIKTSDICVVSSNIEGFGLVAVESMASGTPVIASDIDGIREVVEGGGVLFKKGDQIDLKDKILKLMENNDYYNEIRISGIKKSKLFELSNMVDHYCNLYNSYNNTNFRYRS